MQTPPPRRLSASIAIGMLRAASALVVLRLAQGHVGTPELLKIRKLFQISPISLNAFCVTPAVSQEQQ